MVGRVAINAVVAIAVIAVGADSVPSHIDGTLMKVIVCSRRLSYMLVKCCNSKLQTSCALTFDSTFAMFNRLSPQNRLTLVGDPQGQQIFVSMTSAGLPDLLAGQGSKETAREAARGAAGNKGKLMGSGRTKIFV